MLIPNMVGFLLASLENPGRGSPPAPSSLSKSPASRLEVVGAAAADDHRQEAQCAQLAPEATDVEAAPPAKKKRVVFSASSPKIVLIEKRPTR